METSSLLIKKRRQPKTRAFMAVFLVTLLLIVINQMYINISSRLTQSLNQQVTTLSMLSQQIGRNAQALADGDSAIFPDLYDARLDFDSMLVQISKGGSAGSPMSDFFNNTVIDNRPALVETIISREFPEFPEIWQNTEQDIDLVLENQPLINEVNAQAAVILNIMPLVQREYDLISERFTALNLPTVTLAAAQRQSWLAERIAFNLREIIAGDTSSYQADQLLSDLKLFADNHTAFQAGDSRLGIDRINDPQALDGLINVSVLFSSISETASIIHSAIPEINIYTGALANIVINSELLLAQIKGIGDLLAAQGIHPFASPIVGYVLLFVMLLTILAYGRQVIRQSREAEQISAEKNTRNNGAVVKLLSEISSLGEGDLTVKATVGKDFTGAIADSINYAIEQLRELVSAITSVTMEVTSSTEASMQTVESLSAATKRQTKSIYSVHESMREIGDGINQVNENAQKTLEVAKNSVKTAVGGAAVVKDTIKGMDNIRDQIQGTSRRIKRLGESSQEIGGFVSLINDIAEHTNTLSLNAAIQAASAGEAGKGFAVVADEVHALAERSSDATRQIESLVKVIQGDIKEAVQSMEDTTAEVVSGTRHAQSAGKALDEIQRVSKELQELIYSINEASSNQSKAASEITQSMAVIQQMTANTTSGMEATSKFMSSLGGLSAQLQDAVSGFSLDRRKNSRDKSNWSGLADKKVSRLPSKEKSSDETPLTLRAKDDLQTENKSIDNTGADSNNAENSVEMPNQAAVNA